jgi:hypothetical protein
MLTTGPSRQYAIIIQAHRLSDVESVALCVSLEDFDAVLPTEKKLLTAPRWKEICQPLTFDSFFVQHFRRLKTIHCDGLIPLPRALVPPLNWRPISAHSATECCII